MTVSKLFIIIIRVLLALTAPYWLIRLFFMNKGLNTFNKSFDNDKFFVISFILFVILGGFMFITFVIYLIHNNQKSVAIVLSYKYLRDNYWKDVNRATSGY